MKAWHFCDGWKLRDGQTLVVGKTYTYKGNLIMCKSGLHASIKPLDALDYAPGNIICRVECGGEVIKSNDKLVCSKRTVLAAVDATETLWHFARLCALDVAHLWNAPKVALDYLKTGNEKLRAAAWAAAGAAAEAAARAAARAAAGDAAWAAARAAAWAAAWAVQNKRLNRMLTKALK